MIKFLKNIKKYYKYALYQAKAELKAEVANSYLNWIWWILDPLFFMIIYSFVVQVVFGNNQKYFPVFVFAALTCWDFFNRMISGSVKLVVNNRTVITRVYIPKYILLLSKSFTYLFKYFISFSLLLILMLFFRVSFSWSILWAIPITFVLYVVSFGIASILMHFGVYVDDLANFTNIVLRFLFYLSGIFYDIKSRLELKKIWGLKLSYVLLRYNPIANIIYEMRVALLDGGTPSIKWLVAWLIIGLILTIIGVNTIHEYENSYAKVI